MCQCLPCSGRAATATAMRSQHNTLTWFEIAPANPLDITCVSRACLACRRRRRQRVERRRRRRLYREDELDCSDSRRSVASAGWLWDRNAITCSDRFLTLVHLISLHFLRSSCNSLSYGTRARTNTSAISTVADSVLRPLVSSARVRRDRPYTESRSKRPRTKCPRPAREYHRTPFTATYPATTGHCKRPKSPNSTTSSDSYVTCTDLPYSIHRYANLTALD